MIHEKIRAQKSHATVPLTLDPDAHKTPFNPKHGFIHNTCKVKRKVPSRQSKTVWKIAHAGTYSYIYPVRYNIYVPTVGRHYAISNKFCFQVYCTAFSYCTRAVRFSYRTSSCLGTLWVKGSSLGTDCESGLTAKVNIQIKTRDLQITKRPQNHCDMLACLF